MTKKRKADDPPTEETNHEGRAHTNSEELDGRAGRRKKPAQARTLRACDRCQHRKLACDGALDCCQQCQKANTWCTMTDPVTGTAYYRGQFDYLERKVQKQNKNIKDLLARLRALGQDVSDYEASDKETERYKAWANVRAVDETKPWEREERQVNELPLKDEADGDEEKEMAPHTEHGDAREAPQSDSRPTTSSRLAAFPARNFVGVSTHNVLSQTRPGTRLNILGWELDIANFTEEEDEFEQLPDPEHPIYDRSYPSFIATAHGLQPRLHDVQLPSRQQAFKYAMEQLHTAGAFSPVLHEPSLMELLTKLYDDRNFRPSLGEEVCIHMCFAVAYYQTATRNFHNKEYAGFHELSNRHYHYALGFWPQLMIGNTLEDMQALAMISTHTRTFPKPEVGWAVMCATFSRLIQLDYHRSPNSEQLWVAQKSFLELEMRKRVFWSVLVLLASANGKLGRPMPLRWEDFDVEIPLAVSDEQLTPTGRDESRGGLCHFLLAIEGYRIFPIFADLYSTLYALRKFPQDSQKFVEKAEKRVQDWWDTRHPDLREDSKNSLMRVLSQYLRSLTLEYRLLLYHPSLSLSESPLFNEMHLRKCMEAAKGLLGVATVLKEYKTMDTTWYNCAIYILAIQTTLYGYHSFRNELTAEKLKALRADMNKWLGIMADVGCLLGSGMRLKQAIGRQIDEGLGHLEQHLRQKNSFSSIKRESSDHSKPARRQSATLRRSSSSATPLSHHDGFQQFPNDSQAGAYPSHSGYGPGVVMPNPQDVALAPYGFNQPSQGSFGDSIGTAYAPTQNVATGTHALDPTSLTSYSEHHGHAPDGHNVNEFDIANSGPHSNAYPTMQIYGGDNMSWYQYTQILGASVMGPQDYQPAATALLQLGGRSDSSGNFHAMAPNGPYDGEHMAAAPSQAWPFVILDPQSDQH